MNRSPLPKRSEVNVRHILIAAQVIIAIALWAGDSYAQQDTAKARWFRNYYSGFYLNGVLSGKAHNYSPRAGVIPDSVTAVQVGVIILSKAYGDSVIESEKPFTAVLSKGYWVVYGDFHSPKKGGLAVMGVAEIVIKRATGEVKSISHGK